MLKSAGIPLGRAATGSRASSRCSSRHIAYRGQPIALVAADTLEAAIEGARWCEPPTRPNRSA